MFDETRCDRCGECLVRCLYVDYDQKRAAFEIDELIAGRPAPILSACVFNSSDAELFHGRLFEGLPTVKGRHLFCYILLDHLGAGSVTRRHAQTFVDNLAATGAEEVILFHDDCYGMLVDRAPQFGINVPFRPVHVVEYLQHYLEEHRQEITPLGLRIAYQRPCASRMSPGKEDAVDAVLNLIGVARVQRRYDRENCLCCGLAAATFNPQQAPDIRQLALNDALDAGAQAICYLCPMCRGGLADDARHRGLAGYHIVELARMALGELPVPG
jgi:Fe-S oxidoreductase